MTGRILVTLIVVIASFGRPAAAQDALADAKVLYDKAAYDEALKLLDQVLGSDAGPEVQQYRVLCLIALGRTDAAEQAIATVVAENPFFTPDPREVAPRVVAMFADTRRRLLPQIVRRVFTEARGLFRDGDRQLANQRFDEVLRLLDDAVLSEDASLADLRLVAGGFVDLVRAQPPAPQSAPPAQPTQAVESPAGTNATAVPEPLSTPVVTPAAAISQSLPRWYPPDAGASKRVYSGAVRLTIDAAGKVTSATMVRTAYPPYDLLVLEAARGWLYRPATRDGKGIDSETIVEIRLGPPQN